MPFRWLLGVLVPNASLLRVKGSKPQTSASFAQGRITPPPNGGIIGDSTEKADQENAATLLTTCVPYRSIYATLPETRMTIDRDKLALRFALWTFAYGRR